MKKFSKFFLGLASVALMASCSDDLGKEMGNQPGTDGEVSEITDPVYLSVNFQMPSIGTGSRSFTDKNEVSNNGTEPGTDKENNVGEVLVILARPNDYGLIASAVVQSANITKNSSASPIYRATTKFSKTTLSQYYSDKSVTDEQKGKVAVFIVVNPNKATNAVQDAEYGDQNWAQSIGTVTEGSGSSVEGSIWNDNAFLMSNQRINIRKIPSSIEGWNPYSDGNNLFHLSDMNGVAGAVANIDNSANSGGGAIKVERVAARFDFRDGSPLKDNKYHVMYLRKNDGTPDMEKPFVDIQLDKIALTNMSKTYYVFGRVSDNGQNTVTYDQTQNPNKWLLCGAEMPWFSDAEGTEIAGGNYVVSTNAAEKANGEGISANFAQYFNYPFFDPDGTINNANVQSADRWDVSLISTVLAQGEDQWEGSADNRYHVWRYVTENTIPGIDNQNYGQSTLVVFKGKMQGIKDNLKNPAEIDDKTTPEYLEAKNRWDLVETLNNTDASFGDSNTAPILYAFNGVLYNGWESMRETAIKNSLKITYNDNMTDFTYSWNRDNSLYKAVFGSGATGETIEVEKYDPAAADGSQTVSIGKIEDNGVQDETSPNYLWNAWKKDDSTANLEAFKKAATSEKNMITIYQRSQDAETGWGYYCYYYYKNRHNDNGKPGVMGPMEFAVVRNNVYKLAVTNIKQLGHPRVSLNDPLVPKPGTPDESEELRITVDAEVLPWVVRVNDIEF